MVCYNTVEGAKVMLRWVMLLNCKQLLYSSFIAIALLSNSCDHIMTSLKKEFDSERALPMGNALAQKSQQEELSSPESEEGNFVYFIRGYDISLAPIKKKIIFTYYR